MKTPESIPGELDTPRQLTAWALARLESARLSYGHGTGAAGDDAAWLVAGALDLAELSLALSDDRIVDASARARLAALVARRIDERVPVAYLLNEAWFAGFRFFVDKRVLVPRSPIAELVETGFAPWIDAEGPSSILEIGTGSGCVALACALRFPQARVVATDISEDALDVARRNRADLGLEHRVELICGDLYAGTHRQFDLVVSNPPYVPHHEISGLPAEFGHEPAIGLDGGIDGLDLVRRIVIEAPAHLTARGYLVLEVGHIWPDLENAFPRLPFTWIELEHGGEGVAIVDRESIEFALE